MRRMARRIPWIALVGLVLPLLMTSAAFAQYREFTGRIDKINNKKMIVDNRMGDKVTFERAKDVKIDDTSGKDKPKKKWKQLRKDDWVTVKWKMMDKPRKAYEVQVLPPKKEAGEEM